MWFIEIFLVFYDINGTIERMEVANTVEEYFQWGAVAGGYNLEILIIEEDEYDKVIQKPTFYKVSNKKLKYAVEYAVC
jgi:hypothetical protein